MRSSSKTPEESARGEVWSVAQAASWAGVSEQALRKQIRKGTLPAEKRLRGGQMVTVIPRAALENKYESSAPRRGKGEGTNTQDPRDGPWREELAAERARREAAESQARRAEERAVVAEEKLEQALVRRGDEITTAMKDGERAAMAMALELARSQVREQRSRELALPNPSEPDRRVEVPSHRAGWWLLTACSVAAIGASVVLWRAWEDSLGRLDDAEQTVGGLRGRLQAGESALLEAERDKVKIQEDKSRLQSRISGLEVQNHDQEMEVFQLREGAADLQRINSEFRRELARQGANRLVSRIQGRPFLWLSVPRVER